MEVARDVPHVPANSERMSGKRARTEDVASSTELNRGDRVLFQDKKSLWYEGVLGSMARPQVSCRICLRGCAMPGADILPSRGASARGARGHLAAGKRTLLDLSTNFLGMSGTDTSYDARRASGLPSSKSTMRR
eukprot:2479217-Rhodomonas_salina.2